MIIWYLLDNSAWERREQDEMRIHARTRESMREYFCIIYSSPPLVINCQGANWRVLGLPCEQMYHNDSILMPNGYCQIFTVIFIHGYYHHHQNVTWFFSPFSIRFHCLFYFGFCHLCITTVHGQTWREFQRLFCELCVAFWHRLSTDENNGIKHFFQQYGGCWRKCARRFFNSILSLPLSVRLSPAPVCLSFMQKASASNPPLSALFSFSLSQTRGGGRGERERERERTHARAGARAHTHTHTHMHEHMIRQEIYPQQRIRKEETFGFTSTETITAY